MDSPRVRHYVSRQMTDILVKLVQVAIALAVMFGAIYFQQTMDYPLNPNIVAAWSFMATYGATLLAVRLLDRRVRLGRILPRFGRKQGTD